MAVDDVVVVDVVVVDMGEVDLIDDHVRFGTYIARLRSSTLRNILSVTCGIRSKADWVVLSLLPAVPILVERPCNPSSSPVIVKNLPKL